MFWYSDDLRIAHQLKESFNNVLKSKSSDEAKKELKLWIQKAKESGILDFATCVKVFSRWFEEIANAFDVPYYKLCN